MSVLELEKLADFSHDEKLIAEAIVGARLIQEFLWDIESISQRPFEAKVWQAAFQKRCDAIGNIDLSKPSALVELRKRLLQQASLSIKALVVLKTHGVK